MLGEVGGGILGIVSYSASFAAPLVCLTTLYASFVAVSGSLLCTQKIVVYTIKNLACRGILYTYIYDGSSGILDNSNVILVESTISLCGQCNSRHTCDDSDILPTSFVYCSSLCDISIYKLL